MKTLSELSVAYDVPLEDALMIALNKEGVAYDCEYDRLRTQLRLDDSFEYARVRDEKEFYLALPIHTHSPFKLEDNILLLDGEKVGEMQYTTEDICNSHYWRRGRTALNINPNRRTECRGCGFCYAIFQIPNDNRKLRTKQDFSEFFRRFLGQYGMEDLSGLIEISMVTGCYANGTELVETISNLYEVAVSEFGFSGKIFYLGSQINEIHLLESMENLSNHMRICFSIEVFENRKILRGSKQALSLDMYRHLMEKALSMGFETSYSYVLGLEPLATTLNNMKMFMDTASMFPIINILQIHRGQNHSLRSPDAGELEFYLEARKGIENLYLQTDKRPEPWRDYRNLWYLKFADEALTGVRTPHGPGNVFLEPHDLVGKTSF